MSSSSHSGVLKEGWLEKKGSFIKSWKRRFFSLTPTSLDYYLDETKAVKKGSVAILTTSRVMHRDGSSHHFKFGVLTGKRLLEISCTSEKDRTRWTKAVQELINRIQVETMRTGNLAPALSERATIFEGIIVKNRIDRTNMVEDTPMNRARKKQQEQAATQKQEQGQTSTQKQDQTLNGLKKDNKEKALWGGSDSDLSEENFSDDDADLGKDEQKKGRQNRTTASKKGTRRRLGGSGKAKKSGSATSANENVNDINGESVRSTSIDSSSSSTLQKGNGASGGLNIEEKSPKASESFVSDWEECVSENGEIYFYHRASRVTRWERPTQDVTDCINRRLTEERRQRESATEKRVLEQKQNKFVEEELQQYTDQIKSDVAQQIQLWKHPVGKKRPRVLGELLNAIPTLLGPTVIPADCSLAAQPLRKTDEPSKIKKSYRNAVRLVHPDKIAGTGSVIDVEKKMLAAEVFIAINEAFEKFRMQHDEL